MLSENYFVFFAISRILFYLYEEFIGWKVIKLGYFVWRIN